MMTPCAWFGPGWQQVWRELAVPWRCFCLPAAGPQGRGPGAGTSRPAGAFTPGKLREQRVVSHEIPGRRLPGDRVAPGTGYGFVRPASHLYLGGARPPWGQAWTGEQVHSSRGGAERPSGKPSPGSAPFSPRYPMGRDSAINRDAPCTAMWLDLEMLTVREARQAEKDERHAMSLTCHKLRHE